jgi:hypothetical protein
MNHQFISGLIILCPLTNDIKIHGEDVFFMIYSQRIKNAIYMASHLQSATIGNLDVLDRSLETCDAMTLLRPSDTKLA